MATDSSGIGGLYTAVVQDLVAYYDNAVLLPNPALITNSFNIAGSSGDSVKVPLTDAWTTGNSSIGEQANVLLGTGDQSFTTSDVTLAAVKRGAGTQVSEEALEDGQFDVVRNAVLTRLSRSIAQATDQAGFKTMLNNTETVPANGADLDGADSNIELVNQATINGAANGNIDVNVVFSPEAMAYMSKREPMVKMQEDVEFDRYIMTGTLRNAFGQLRPGFIKGVASSTGIQSNADLTCNLIDFATSVAKLRDVNAPADDTGFYYAAVTPGAELALSNELSGVGSTGTTSIGSLSDIGNRVLLESIISEAIGIRWVRSNNLVENILNTVA
jgi:hypothetical protein